MKKMLLTFAVLLLAACATGPRPINDDTLHIVRHGFASTEPVRKQILKEAADFCTQEGKSLEVVRVITNSPPFVNLHFPKAEVQFRCVGGMGSAGR